LGSAVSPITSKLLPSRADGLDIGQLALRNASVLVIGVGGLGCPAAAYLAGAGVGKIGLVDGDTVELSNLHRQILHNEKSIGQHKVDSAAERLRAYVTHGTSTPSTS